MAEFTAKPLGILERIYRFVGGLRGIRTVDLGSDITIVHDVSRQAEVNGLGGYSGNVLWQGQLVNAGGGSNETILERIADVQPAIGMVSEDYELWIMEAHGWTASASNFTSLLLATGRDTGSAPIGTTQYAVRIGTQQPELQPLAYFSAFRTLEDDLGNTRSAVSTNWPLSNVGAAYIPAVPFQPIRVPIGGFVEWYYVTTGAATMNFTVRMWAGPLGSRPPGIA